MIRYLVLIEVIELPSQIIEQSGGVLGIRDFGALESALAQPHMTFGGEELYPTLVDKASAIWFSFVINHPFIPPLFPFPPYRNGWRRWGIAEPVCRAGGFPP